LNNPVKYNDPTGHYSVLGDFFSGFFLEAASNLLWFDRPYQEIVGTKSTESSASLAGRVVADVASIVLGADAIATGGGLAVGGTGLSCVGTACALAPVAIGGGVAVAAEGAGMGVSGALNLGKNLVLMSKSSTSGENSYAQQGRDAHDKLPQQYGPGFDYNRPLSPDNPLKPDAIDWENGIILELKPNNPAAIAKGWAQIKKYLAGASQLKPDMIWTGQVITYDR
jgi:hypothetical protein